MFKSSIFKINRKIYNVTSVTFFKKPRNNEKHENSINKEMFQFSSMPKYFLLDFIIRTCEKAGCIFKDLVSLTIIH